MRERPPRFSSLCRDSPSPLPLTTSQTGPSLVQPSTLCRKRPRSDRSKVTSGALEKEDQGLKSNPFGQKRVKTSAASFFTDSASKSAPPKKSKFDTTKVKGSKAKKGKEKAKPPPALEEKKISKAEKSKRKVFDEDSDEEEEGEVDDDGTGFLDVSVDSSKDESKLTKGGGANGDDFEGDESSDDEHEKVSPKEKIEEAEPEPTIPNEKVYGAMDGFATAPKPAAAVGEVVNGKRRVTKKRFVEREEMDGKGYMHTTTVEETYEEWEVVEEAKVKMPVRSGVKGGGKKAGKVQKGLMGFFTKK